MKVFWKELVNAFFWFGIIIALALTGTWLTVGDGKPAVQNVVSPTAQEMYFNSCPAVVKVMRPDGGFGTGFFVDTHTIATAYHIVDGLQKVSIFKYGSSTLLIGKVVEFSKDSDIALVEVATENPNKYLNISPRRQQVGDSVYVLGHPYGLWYTFTSGMISNVDRRTIGYGLDGVVQIDAPINSGNSGGPVFDKRGDVIGVVSYGYDGDGLGCIIPVKYLKAMME